MCIDSAEKVIKDYEYPELSNLDFFQVAHAQWLARRSLDQAVQVGTYWPRTWCCVLGYIRHYTLTVPLSIQVYKWGLTNYGVYS